MNNDTATGAVTLLGNIIVIQTYRMVRLYPTRATVCPGARPPSPMVTVFTTLDLLTYACLFQVYRDIFRGEDPWTPTCLRVFHIAQTPWQLAPLSTQSRVCSQRFLTCSNESQDQTGLFLVFRGSGCCCPLYLFDLGIPTTQLSSPDGRKENSNWR